MRILLFSALAAGTLVVAACGADRYPGALGPDASMLVPASSEFSGRCFNADLATDVGEGNGADANGNGWVCVDGDDGHHYDDRPMICYPPSTPVTSVGDPADRNGNGFVCVNPDGTKVDDDAGKAQDGPGDLPGGDIVCPEGYDPSLMRPPPPGAPGSPVLTDENGNGWICTAPGLPDVDDILDVGPVLLTLTAGKVNGHGVFDVPDATLSFSFHAKSDGDAVKGNFEFHDRDGGARYHGDVTCLEVDGATAMLEGVVTIAKESAPPVGTTITWIAVDNGEGKKAPADRVSEPEIGGPTGDPCGPAPVGEPVDIRGGNIQVKN